MANKATLINEKGIKQVVDVGSQNASSLMGSGYQLMGASGKYTPTTPATPAPTIASTTPVTNTPAPTTPTTIPEGATRIADPNELKNLTEEQIYRDTTSNAIYKKPEAVVPNTISQTDFSSAMSPEEAGKLEAKANNNIQFSEEQITDLNKAYQRQVAGTASDTDNKNIAYAKGKGWQPSETKTEETAKPKTTEEMIYDLYSNIGKMKAEAKAEAMKENNLDEKSQAIAESQSYVNRLRTELQNQGIIDIKEQDVIRAKPILNSQVAAQLNELSREQKLDSMILQNNYNNALVEQQIAQGNYDRAREIVKETTDDYYDNLQFQLDALKYKNQIEDKAYERRTKELEEDRSLAKEGYVYVSDPAKLQGLTEDKIYRDPISNKVYLKPEPEVASTMEIGGVTYGFDSKGNKIVTYGVTEKPKSGGGNSTTPESIDDVDYVINDVIDANITMTPSQFKLSLEKEVSAGNLNLSKTQITTLVSAFKEKQAGNKTPSEKNADKITALTAGQKKDVAIALLKATKMDKETAKKNLEKGYITSGGKNIYLSKEAINEINSMIDKGKKNWLGQIKIK